METQCPRYSTVEYGVQEYKTGISYLLRLGREKESGETTAELFCFASSKCQDWFQAPETVSRF